MSDTKQFRTQRLRTLHQQLLQTYQKFPMFHHIAVRSSSTILNDIFRCKKSPWSEREDGQHIAWLELFQKRLWDIAVWSTDLPNMVSFRPDRYVGISPVLIDSNEWYSTFFWTQGKAMYIFDRLSVEASHVLGVSSLLDFLYQAYPENRRRLRYADSNFNCVRSESLSVNAEDWIDVAWLPTNVFLAIAEQIESLRQTDSKPDSKKETSIPVPENPREPGNRVQVMLTPPQVTVDGTAYAVSPDGALLVDELLKADAEWISGENLMMRVDRVKKNLPKPVLDLIESVPGKGHRIPRQALT